MHNTVAQKIQVLVLIMAVCMICISGCRFNIYSSSTDNIIAEFNSSKPTLGTSTTAADVVPTEGYSFGGYYYAEISDSCKYIYEQLYAGIPTCKSQFEIIAASDDDINNAFQSVLYDHPEIFYVKGYSLQKESGGKYIFIPIYSKKADEVDSARKDIDKYVSKALSKVPDGSSDYEKVKDIYEYIVTNTDYEVGSKDSDNIYSVMKYGKSVCEGYAKSMMYLLKKEGIECTIITGNVKSSGTAHMWNAVYVDGDWYYVDPTWGDTQFENSQGTPEVRYDYMMITTEQLLQSHKISCIVPPPDCNSTKDNYYVKSNLMITDDSKGTLKKALAGIDKGEKVTFMCGSYDLYNKVKTSLITMGEIYSYMDDDSKDVKFSTNDSLYILSFWTS